MSSHREADLATLQAMTAALVAEFAGSIPSRTVHACVAVAREELLSQGVRAGLVVATEAMARRRLSDRVPAHVSMPLEPVG